MQRMLPHKRLSLAFAIFVAMAVVAAGSYLAIRLSGIASPKAAQSLPMPQQLKPDDFWPGQQGVLHAIVAPPAGSDATSTAGVQTELWFDPRNMRARQETRAADGIISHIAVADGDHYASYDSGMKKITQRRLLNGGGWTYWLQTEGEFVMGEALVNLMPDGVQRTTLQGANVLRFQRPVLGENGEKVGTTTTYLDPTTKLPIRFEQEAATNQEGVGNGSSDVKYTVVEWLPRQALDADLFKLPSNLPNVTSTTTETYMTADEARKFGEFDVYYLGDTFQNLKLYDFLEFREDSTFAGTSISTHYFAADYSSDGTNATPVLQVTSELEDKSIKSAWNTPELDPSFNSKRDVTVHNTTGFYYPPGRLFLQIDRTVIEVEVRESPTAEQTILAAGDALVKLNQ